MAVPRPCTQIHPVRHPPQTLCPHRLPLERRAEGEILKKEILIRSSNGQTGGSALLWCTVPYGDANATVTDGRLLVYDPEHFITNADGSKTLAVLWDSQPWNIEFK